MLPFIRSEFSQLRFFVSICTYPSSNDMNKTKKFVGQPILSQILKLVPAEIVRCFIISRFNANHYYKRIPVQLHLTSLLYGVFTYCNGTCRFDGLFEGLKSKKESENHSLSLMVDYGLRLSNFIEDFNRIKKLRSFMELKQF